MLMLSLLAINSFELSEDDMFDQKWYQSELSYKNQDSR